MKQTKRIIVDIDNTLWDFASVFFECLRAMNPEMPPPRLWQRWDFLKLFLPDKTLFSVLRGIHMRQDTFTPFPDARHFLDTLRERGFFIIIASHRDKEALDPTVRWLNMHNLVHDEVYLSYDKSVLFDGCRAVVDDSPIVLERARKAGIVRTGLRYPWNEQEDHPLFDSLGEVLDYLRGAVGETFPAADVRVPFEGAYWVVPGKLLAGYYPGDKDPESARKKAAALVECGIRHVVNLMEEHELDRQGEPFVPYHEDLMAIGTKTGTQVAFIRLSVKDCSAPSKPRMRRILDEIDGAIADGRPVYIHCLGGKGRTGAVVGCYLARHGMAVGEGALVRIADLRSQNPALTGRSPENDNQCDMVRSWKVGR
jgi:hypothetical protein